MTSRYRPELADVYLDRLSPANKELSRKYLTARRAEGLTASSCITMAKCLLVFDRHLQGQPFPDVEPSTISAFLAEYRNSHASSSVHREAATLRTFYAWQHDGELSTPMRRAFKHKRPPVIKLTTLVTKEEFEAILRAVGDVKGRRLENYYALHRAILWGLWDTGMRISELLSLRLGGCVFDDRGGARLTLPADAPDLKTGPRSIYVIECVGALKAWLVYHKTPQDRDAPLFPSPRQSGALDVNTVGKALAEYCKRGGTRHVHPHLFRHTRATRAAEAGWNEAELRSYFGWAPGSSMASHYVHLAQAHMEERVRRDAQLGPLGARIQADPKQAMAELVASTLQALGIAPAASTSPRRDPDDDGAAAPVARV